LTAETNVAQKAVTPSEFALAQNYPNPFNPTTTIAFSLNKTQDVTVDVYDLSGHKVKTLVSGVQTAGVHTLQWDATNDIGERASSGVYLYRLNAGDRVETRKMMFLK
jgi:flagellar hook assembly protein FlgD